MPLDKIASFVPAHDSEIVASPATVEFERIARVAAKSLSVPIVLIILEAENSHWVKFSFGLSMSEAQVLSRYLTRSGNEEVSGAAKTRLKVPGKTDICFYAASTLSDNEGNQIGRFWIADYAPRQLEADDVQILQDLAAWAQTQLNIKAAKINSTSASEHRLINLASELFCTIGKDDCFQYLNPAWKKILGWSVAELLVTPYWELVHPNERNTTQKKLELIQDKVASDEIAEPWDAKITITKLISFENRLQCRDGRYRWFSWHARYCQEEELIEAAICDITELKIAEKELIQQFEQLQCVYHWANLIEKVSRADRIEEIYQESLLGLMRVLNTDKAAISIFDPDGSMMFQVGKGLSGKFRRSLAFYSPWSSLNIDPQPVLFPDVTVALDLGEMQAKMLNEGIGACAWIPLVSQGEVFGRFGIYYDQKRKFDEEEIHLAETLADYIVFAIERKQAESALQRSQLEIQEKAKQLEATLEELKRNKARLVQSEKMSSLGQLVAGVAHEINNPVNFIYGNIEHANHYTQDLLSLLQLYQKYYPEPALEIQDEAEAIELDFLIEDLPKLLNSMKVGAERIHKIVLSLRNFSRMDEAEVKDVNIHEGMDNTLMILQNRLKAKSNFPGIEIIKNYGELPLVECYPGQLNQVFMNILSNGIDALEQHVCESPKIWIETKVLDSDRVQIKIADNGTGIPEDIQQRLFDPFFTTKPVGSGTGLGLSISYQIVTEKHRGELRCHSVLGKGTEFLIEIPLKLGIA
jgi:PAS domain S-box-containing protein